MFLPAQEAGLQIGDILVAVAGESVREKDSGAVRDLVRGEEGTYVDLTVLRQETEKTFSVERRAGVEKISYFCSLKSSTP